MFASTAREAGVLGCNGSSPQRPRLCPRIDAARAVSPAARRPAPGSSVATSRRPSPTAIVGNDDSLSYRAPGAELDGLGTAPRSEMGRRLRTPSTDRNRELSVRLTRYSRVGGGQQSDAPRHRANPTAGVAHALCARANPANPAPGRRRARAPAKAVEPPACERHPRRPL